MENTPDHDMSALFGKVVYTYTRAQAIADGFQVEVSQTATDAGIRFPVFLTRGVYDGYVIVPPGITGQDEAGRLWDILWMLRFAIRKSPPGLDRLPFRLYVRQDNRRSRLVELFATCGPLDIDNPQPAITVMLPGGELNTWPTRLWLRHSSVTLAVFGGTVLPTDRAAVSERGTSRKLFLPFRTPTPFSATRTMNTNAPKPTNQHMQSIESRDPTSSTLPRGLRLLSILQNRGIVR